MNLASQPQKTDPLRVFVESHLAKRSGYPIPLVSTDFDVDIEAGLAIVTTKRVFKNAEEESIEATLTFPVPVHATLFDLRAKIGERSLVARASRKDVARATYEDAIERGKSAVLHEELLRGVHMLSVAHIPPGETIEVITTWAMTLTMIGAEGHLRIPLTVGDVYGRSPLSDADDLTSGGKPLIGTLKINSPDAPVRLVNGFLENGKTRLQLNRPIDLVIEPWRSRALKGITANGRSISLLLEPVPSSPTPLNVAILVDHSGSMNEPASAGPHPISKHGLVVAALGALSEGLGSSDLVELWEFDNTTKRIGSTGDELRNFERISRPSTGRRLRALVDGLSAPNGGTEIGNAIATTIDNSSAPDIILITDGKSHELDIQALARKGQRISAILIGEDSLEANIGHLAALTGGDIFVSGGADIAELFHSALDALRGNSGQLTREDTETAAWVFQRAGMMATLSFGSSGENSEQDKLTRGVAATVASFLLPTLDEVAASELAEREGIVSHLTSLVLVDEAGVTQSGLPSQRRVHLPHPASTLALIGEDVGDRFFAPARSRIGESIAGFPSSESRVFAMLAPEASNQSSANKRYSPGRSTTSSDELAKRIDWGSQPSRLLAGDVSQLPPDVQKILKSMAKRNNITAAAQTLNITPLLLVIALIARDAGLTGDRSAKRIARAVLKGLTTEQLDQLALLLRIKSGRPRWKL